MPTERKIAMVADLTDRMSRMQLAVVTDYRGLTVAEITELRDKLLNDGADFVVAKNTLVRLAARATGNEAIEPLLEGPTALAFAYDDVTKVAKTLDDYISSSQKVSVRGGLLGKTLLPPDGLAQVKRLPSREQVLAQIAGGIQSPIASFVGVLNAPLSDVVGILNAVVSDVVYVLQARIDQMQSTQ